MNSEVSNVLKLSPVTVVKAEKQAEPQLSSTGNGQNVARSEVVTVASNDLKVSTGNATEEKSKDSNKEGANSTLDLVKKAVDEGNLLLQVVKRNLQFKVDGDTQELVVKIVDSESGETVRQIPSDEMLALIKRMQESEEQLGLMIRDRA